jgi:hypothetical protein
MKNIEIYQIKSDIDENIYRKISFMRYDMVNDVIDLHKFRDYYKKVYEFTQDFESTSDQIILDEIFAKFNIDRPDDFKGHSLSISDIVIIDDKAYFCDSWGWINIE